MIQYDLMYDASSISRETAIVLRSVEGRWGLGGGSWPAPSQGLEGQRDEGHRSRPSRPAARGCASCDRRGPFADSMWPWSVVAARSGSPCLCTSPPSRSSHSSASALPLMILFAGLLGEGSPPRRPAANPRPASFSFRKHLGAADPSGRGDGRGDKISTAVEGLGMWMSGRACLHPLPSCR